MISESGKRKLGESFQNFASGTWFGWMSVIDQCLLAKTGLRPQTRIISVKHRCLTEAVAYFQDRLRVHPFN